MSETTPGNLRVGDFNDPLSASGNLEYSDGWDYLVIKGYDKCVSLSRFKGMQ